jgi:hypothetical protein
MRLTFTAVNICKRVVGTGIELQGVGLVLAGGGDL